MIAALFPALSRPSRTVFGIAFVAVVGVTIGTALLRWQPPLIAIVGFGLPLLFVAYLIEIRAAARLAPAVLIVIAVLSVVFGIGWAIGTEMAIAREGADALGIPPSTTRIVITGLAIPLSFIACLLAPVLVIRLWQPGPRTSLHGYLVGALTASGFVASSTLTRLAPSFAGFNTESTRSASSLAVAAVIQGIALPVIAVAVAGAVGASLWLSADHRLKWYAPTAPVSIAGFAVLAFAGLGALDIAAVSFEIEMVTFFLLTVLAIVGLRKVARSTRSRETGSATTKYAAGGDVSAAHASRLLLGIATAVAVLVAGSAGLAAALTPPPPNYVCPPECGRPPISKPVATNPRFTPATGEFSVSYPGEGTAYNATLEPNGVVLELVAGDGGVLRLFGQPAEGRTPEEITKQLVADHYRGATFAYEIPNALVGYHLGYGEVADVFPTASVGDDTRARVLVMVAVKNDYALVAAGAGPFREFTPDFGSGHPSGANFMLALDMGKYVNSFMWRGDPPR